MKPVRRPIVLSIALLLVCWGVAPAAALIPVIPIDGIWGVNGRVNATLYTSNSIFIAGTFTSATSPDGSQSLPRQNLVVLDAATGAPRDWAPNPNKAVFDLALSEDGSRVFLSGDFTKVSGQQRLKVAAMSATSGALDATWKPKASARVEALEAVNGKVYLGGQFLTVNDVSRTRLAAVDQASGALDPLWTPAADGVIHDMVFAPNNRILVGGDFTSINGVTNQRKLSALNPNTGAPISSFVPRPAYETFDITVDDATVYTAAGGSGGHAAAYDLDSGENHWVSFGDGDAEAAHLMNNVLYIGGHFDNWVGLPQKKLVALDPVTGQRLSWSARINSALGVFSLASSGRRLTVGGDFTRLGKSRNHFGIFEEPVDVVPPTAPGTPVASSTAYTSITLSIPAATDNLATSLTYSLYRDGGGTPIGIVTSTVPGQPVRFVDTDLPMGTPHTYAARASDGIQSGPMSQTSAPISTDFAAAPVLESLAAFDRDTDGHLDRVTVTFSHDVFCGSPCLSPWSFTGLPAGTSLSSVSVEGRRVQLDLDEGGGAPSTAVGNLKVALSSANGGVEDAQGDNAGFGQTPVADRMGPVPVAITSSDVGGHPGLMEAGDTMQVTFSEPIDPDTVFAANVKQFDPPGDGNDEMNIVGLSSTIDLGSDDYVDGDNSSAAHVDSTLTLNSARTRITSTIVGACSGLACTGRTGVPSSTVTFSPEYYLKDAAGNPATGSLTCAMTVF